MKKFVLALAALVVVAALGLLAWWSWKNDAIPASSAPREVAKAPAASAEIAPARLETAADLDGKALQPDRASLTADADTAGLAADRRRIRGRVQLAAACDDPAREVFALPRETSLSRLASIVDPEPDPDEEDDNPFDSASRKDRDKDAEILARGSIREDGTFVLDVPKTAKRVWIAVRGRYQFTQDSREVDTARLDAAKDELVVQAECGACVVVRVLLPDASADAASLDGDRVSIEPAAEGFAGMQAMNRAVRESAPLAGIHAELLALPRESKYTLHIEPKKFAAAELALHDLEAGKDTVVELQLRRGGTVRGLVTDAQHAPIAGARVRASLAGRWFGFDDRTVRTAKTGADGTFELVAVATGQIGLRASHPKYLDSDVTKIDLKEGGVATGSVLVLEGGSVVSGTVRWADGTTAAGVSVDATFDMSQMYGMSAMNALRGGRGHAVSDAEGKFSIGGLGKGPFTLQASAEPRSQVAAADVAKPKKTDDKASDKWRARIDGVTAGARDVALSLQAPIGIAGRVTDPDGAAVSAFTILAQRTGTGPMATLGQESHEEKFEDAEGRFLMTGLGTGTWKLYARAEKFAAPLEPITLELPRPEGDTAELVLVLPFAARVSGVVKDPFGHTIADAEVAVNTGQPAWQQAVSSAPKPPKTRTGSDGAFVLEGLFPAAQTLVATARDFAKSTPVPVDFGPSREMTGVEIVLRNGGRLTGEVFDETGRPAVGWMVQATDAQNFDMKIVTSDGQGHFDIQHLEPGQRQVVAMSTGAVQSIVDDSSKKDGQLADSTANFMGKMKMGAATIVDGEETHLVLGAPPKAPVEVHGHVTHAGEPYSGAMISFMMQGKGMLDSASGGLKTAAVGKDGSYKVQLGSPGDYSVSVQKFGASANQQALVEFTRTVPEEKTAQLDFEMPTGRISGRVRGQDHEPVIGARVSLHIDGAGTPGTMWGGQYNESATDADGLFDIQALRPGKYTVLAGGMTAGGMFGDDAAFGREAKSDIDLTAGEWRKGVDFELKKPGAIDLVIVDDAGAPVGGAAVFVRTQRGELLDRFSMISSDAQGQCKYGGLTAGRYTLSARNASLASNESAEVEVRAGERSAARLVLGGGAFLLVSVVDGENKPLTASLSVKDEQGREVGAMVSLAELMKYFSEGAGGGNERRIGPLPSGKYRVKAELADGRTTTKPVTLSSAGERKLTIHL